MILEIVSMSNMEVFLQIFHSLYPHLGNNYWRNIKFWKVDVKTDLKSETGFVGLDNPGCICYHNSLMQQLFMIK